MDAPGSPFFLKFFLRRYYDCVTLLPSLTEPGLLQLRIEADMVSAPHRRGYRFWDKRPFYPAYHIGCFDIDIAFSRHTYVALVFLQLQRLPVLDILLSKRFLKPLIAIMPHPFMILAFHCPKDFRKYRNTGTRHVPVKIDDQHTTCHVHTTRTYHHDNSIRLPDGHGSRWRGADCACW